MKRSDLHHNRNSKHNRMVSTCTSRKCIDGPYLIQKIFPLMHILQCMICIVLFLCLFSYQSSIEESNLLYLLQQYLNYSIDLNPSEFSGTLKDVLIIRK